MIPASLVFTGFLVFGGRNDLAEFLETLTIFFDPSYFAFLAFYVTCIAFVGSSIGGRFVQDITTRQDWITCILKIVGVSWITGSILMLLGVGMLILFHMTDLTTALLGALLVSAFTAQVVLPVTGCLSGVGFVFVGSFAMAVNPEKRSYRMVIGSIASSMVGY
jgi:hypothetical protein